MGEVRPPAAPFDLAAQDYDTSFSETALGRFLRGEVHRRIEPFFRPGMHVLDAGCGTGEDTLWFARRHIEVTALDASAAMIAVAQAKLAAATLPVPVRFIVADLAGGDSPAIGPRALDGAISNFGVLNCVEHRRPLARGLAAALRPGSPVALVVMGPACPWEMLWHLSHLEPGTAFRRLRAGQSANLPGGSIPVWYPAPQRIEREFRPWFRRIKTVGIGSLVPPSHLAPLAERHPRMFRLLAAGERRLAGFFPWNLLNDHYLLLLERTAAPVPLP